MAVSREPGCTWIDVGRPLKRRAVAGLVVVVVVVVVVGGGDYSTQEALRDEWGWMTKCLYSVPISKYLRYLTIM